MTRRYRATGIAAACAALALTACGGDEDAAPEAPEGTAGDGPQYFASDRHLGELVTITAEVTDVYFAGGMGIDAGRWGDETVLVLPEGEDQGDVIDEGDTVRVSGRIETFDYEDYAVTHELVNKGMYERYSGERFINAIAVDLAPTA